MSQFNVDSAQVTAASGAVNASATTIGTEVDRMLRYLTDLSTSWQGAASTSFQRLLTEWTATHHQVHTSLQHIQTSLATAGQQYADVEAANVARFA